MLRILCLSFAAMVFPNSAYAASSGEIIEMLKNIVNDIAPIVNGNAVTGMFFVVGLLFIIRGVKTFTERAGAGYGYGASIIRIVAGIFLIQLPAVMNIISETIFNAERSQISSSIRGGASVESAGYAFIDFSIFIIQVVGFIAIIRSFILLYQSAGNQRGETSGQILTYLIGGTICLNIKSFLSLVANTVGGQALEAFNKIF